MRNRKGWQYDEAREAWDHETYGCVAKDGSGARPWGAYYKGSNRGAGNPNEWCRTMVEAMAACRRMRDTLTQNKTPARTMRTGA